MVISSYFKAPWSANTPADHSTNSVQARPEGLYRIGGACKKYFLHQYGHFMEKRIVKGTFLHDLPDFVEKCKFVYHFLCPKVTGTDIFYEDGAGHLTYGSVFVSYSEGDIGAKGYFTISGVLELIS